MPMPPMPEEATKAFDAMMQIGWLMPLVGIVEIVAGLMIIIPKTRALGALMMVPIMVGIIGSNTFTNISGLPIALVFTIVLLWILVEEKDRLLPIIK